MTEHVPQIGPIEKLYTLHDAYLQAMATLGKPEPDGRPIVMSADELVSGLEPLVSNFASCRALAFNLDEMKRVLSYFQDDLEGKVCDSKKLTNMKSKLFPYIYNIIGKTSLVSEYEGETYLGLRAIVMSFNSAVETWFAEENKAKLNIATQILADNIDDVRDSMFPESGKNAKEYIDSLVELSEFARGTEKVSFRYSRKGTGPYSFESFPLYNPFSILTHTFFKAKRD